MAIRADVGQWRAGRGGYDGFGSVSSTCETRAMSLKPVTQVLSYRSRWIQTVRQAARYCDSRRTSGISRGESWDVPAALRTNTLGSGLSNSIDGEESSIAHLWLRLVCPENSRQRRCNEQDNYVCGRRRPQMDLPQTCEPSSRNGVRSREDEFCSPMLCQA